MVVTDSLAVIVEKHTRHKKYLLKKSNYERTTQNLFPAEQKAIELFKTIEERGLIIPLVT